MFSGIGINPSNLFGGGGVVGIAVAIILGTIVFAGCGYFLWWIFYKRKQWNIKVEFKIPRNIRTLRNKAGDTKIFGTLNKEWGKGFYDAKKGIVLVKRKAKKAVAMKPFDIKRYLSADNVLTVIQIGIEDYRPVLDESYIEVADEATGEEAALIHTKIDTTEGKSWKNSYERERKSTYTIMNWIQQHGTLLAMGVVIMMIFIGFAIVIQRLPSICG